MHLSYTTFNAPAPPRVVAISSSVTFQAERSTCAYDKSPVETESEHMTESDTRTCVQFPVKSLNLSV